MLTQLEGNWVKGTFIFFYNHGSIEGRKTNSYSVMTLENIKLGQIKWFSNWRKYCFYPQQDTVYEEVCLKEIAEFIQQETYNYKKNREKRNANTINT